MQALSSKEVAGMSLLSVEADAAPAAPVANAGLASAEATAHDTAGLPGGGAPLVPLLALLSAKGVMGLLEVPPPAKNGQVAGSCGVPRAAPSQSSAAIQRRVDLFCPYENFRSCKKKWRLLFERFSEVLNVTDTDQLCYSVFSS